MIGFIMIFILSIVALLAVQALDVECVRPRAPRRASGLLGKLRTPFRLPLRGMQESEAR